MTVGRTSSGRYYSIRGLRAALDIEKLDRNDGLTPVLVRDVEVAAMHSLRIGQLRIVLRIHALLLKESPEIGYYGRLL